MECWHTPCLGPKQFPSELSAFDLDLLLALNTAVHQTVASRRRRTRRLSIALQIGFIRMTGRTLRTVQIVPLTELHHVAAQLHLPAPDIASVRKSYVRQRSLHVHHQLARTATGFAEHTDAADRVLNDLLLCKTLLYVRLLL